MLKGIKEKNIQDTLFIPGLFLMDKLDMSVSLNLLVTMASSKHGVESQQVCNNDWHIWIGNKKTCRNFKSAIQEKLQQQ
jgi:hypothetical protein